MSKLVHDEASRVDARAGDVHVKGPDGVDIALTPDAAAETSDRLLNAAAVAQGQQVQARRKEEERQDRSAK